MRERCADAQAEVERARAAREDAVSGLSAEKDAFLGKLAALTANLAELEPGLRGFVAGKHRRVARLEKRAQAHAEQFRAQGSELTRAHGLIHALRHQNLELKTAARVPELSFAGEFVSE
jgi:hypothetical protein